MLPQKGSIMISYFKTVGSELTRLSKPEPGCWVSVVEPTPDEVNVLIEQYGLDRDFVRSSLDEEESSRVEREENQTLIIVDTAVAEKQDETFLFYTLPVGIITTAQYVFTISLKHCPVIDAIENGAIRNLQTMHKTRFVLLLLMRITAGFVQYLKQIDKISYHIEKQLSVAMKNKELVQILGLEKSLVYFTTSLRSNEVVLEKLLKVESIKQYPEDTELLGDVIVENQQAIEMTSIYRDIINGTRELMSSVIDNRLNNVMKYLTSITIVMAIPTVISGIYGMNVDERWMPFANTPHGFLLICVLTLLICIITMLILRKKKML